MGINNFFEKIERNYEEKYCAKYGRERYLRNTQRRFVARIVMNLVGLFIGIVSLILGIILYVKNPSPLPELSIFELSIFLILFGALLTLIIPILNVIIFPSYRKSTKKSKEELKNMKQED